ncbi:hypothetical protein BX666DRAFT_2025803 [Dichotomocladium elegans]|nr:hypothetical protein BX666DRAFT_2025803 [Dichotomocladium elegans]
MPASARDGRRLTGYVTGAVESQGVTSAHLHHQSLYDDGMDDYNHVDENYDADEVDEVDEDSAGSVLSVPGSDIDFDLVYALHTFAATVDGQASVVKGDALTLLDDSNSYWWLIKVLKTSEVGYIPAENIETPFERLARLNSHLNIERTQRDIQDAFPTPPSTKPKSNKKVKLAKGVKFQAQVIFGDSDDDDFEEEFEEWQETIRTDSDTDETDDTDDSEEDDDYYDSVKLYSGASTTDDYGQSPIDNFSRSQQQQHQQQTLLQQPQLHVNTEITQTAPSINSSSPSSASTPRSNMPFRDTLDLEASETIKYSLTPEIARGTDEIGPVNGYRGVGVYPTNDAPQSPQSKAEKLESILSGGDSVSEQRRGSKDKKEKGGLRKLFSRNKDSRDKKQRKGSMDRQNGESAAETASLSSQSTGFSDRERNNSVDSGHTQQHHNHQQYYQQQHARQEQRNQDYQSDDPQPTILKIFAGNITFGAEYKTAQAYESTTAAELIQYALNTFDIQSRPQNANADSLLDYFLVVKGVDGDEYTLVPNDKPVAIYMSLTDHLNMPMPSLKKARRISALMSGSEATHIGGPKGNPDDAEEVRFYLYTKARRPEDAHISIKVSLFASEVDGSTSILKYDQARVDKSVTVPVHASVGDVTAILLDKFHILNGIVDGADAAENAKALRIQGTDGEFVKYQLAVSRQGQEKLLEPAVAIKTAFGEDLLPMVHRRSSSNPDRASIASLTSIITSPPQPDETFFILRRSDRRGPAVAPNSGAGTPPISPPHQNDPSRPSTYQIKDSKNEIKPVLGRPPRPQRQDTPMPKGTNISAPSSTEQIPSRDVHPLAVSTEPNQPPAMFYDEPESDVDVLMKLDEALDNLAHTRNSNEPLTEAIVASSMSRENLSLTPTQESDLPQSQSQSQQSQRQQQPSRELHSARSLEDDEVQTGSEEELKQLVARENTSQNRTRPPVESMLFVEEFGMNELMVLIRGAVRYAEEQDSAHSKSHKHPPIRSEINDVFKESHQRLDQLEKELDRLMAEAVKVYS